MEARRRRDEEPETAAALALHEAGLRSARLPPRSLLGLERLAGNRAVFGLLQRAITIGAETYTAEKHSARNFRRALMINLQANRFKELGTPAMWNRVDGWLGGNPPPPAPFPDWRHFVNALNQQGLLEFRHRRAYLGPHNLGPPPRLATGARQAVGPQPGEDARHVLSRSSLGAAIEKAQATLTVLNGWLLRHGDPAIPAKAPLELSEREARARIWGIAANHVGNLFPGPSDSNEAAGLIRGPLLYVANQLNGREAALVPLSDIKLPSQPQFPWPEFAVHWKLIIEDLEAELKELATPPQRNAVPGRAAKQLIEQYILNADVDLPFQQLRPGYYEKLVPLIEAVKAPGPTFFAMDGALDRFMALDWRD